MTDDSTALLGAELDRLGPSEWAFDTLLKIAAFGFHDSHRHALRELTKTATAQYRQANDVCPGCGHEHHEPLADTWIRDCPTCAAVPLGRRCSVLRKEDGSLTYR